MSGSSYNYAYRSIEEFALEVKEQKDPKRAAFGQLCWLVARAMQDVEWVDSGDYGQDGDVEAIDRVFTYLNGEPEIIKKALAYDSLMGKLKELVK